MQIETAFLFLTFPIISHLLEVQRKDLKGLQQYTENNELRNFRYMKLVPNEGIFYVGSKSFLYKFSMSDPSKNPIKSEELTRDNASKADNCRRKATDGGNSCKENLINFVGVDIPVEKLVKNGYAVNYEEEIVTCGTNYGSPELYVLNKKSLRIKDIPGGKHLPSGKIFCLETPERKFTRSVTVTDKGTPKNQPAVFVAGRMLEEVSFRFYNRLWRYQYDVTEDEIYSLSSNVNNENLFQPSSHTTVIKMIEVKNEDYLLYFFNELALEYTPPKLNPSQLVTRVARVCKKDSNLNGWSSLVKVQIVCQTDEQFEPDQTVVYNRLIDLTMSEDDNRFYGVFKNSGKQSSQTAVCSFSLDEINRALDVDNFYEKRTENSISFLIPSSVPEDIPYKPGICRPASKTKVDEDKVRKYLAKTTIKRDALIKVPFALSKPGVIWDHIVVDEKSGRTEKIFYLTTNKKGISKIALKDNGSVDEITDIYPFDSSIEEDFYKTFELHENSIYFTTDRHVAKLDLKELCKSYPTCTSCSSDPDCSWDPKKNVCQYPGGSFSAPVHVQCSNGMMQKDLAKKRSILDIQLSTNACLKENEEGNQKTVRGSGKDILLSCKSYCDVVDNIVRWFRNGEELMFDDTKYTINKDYSLVVWNVTSQEKGLYTCVTGNLNIVLSIWEVITADCDPNDAECIWRDEFNKWCKKFDEYTVAFNVWKCMEDSCRNSDTDTCDTEKSKIACEEKYKKYSNSLSNR